MARLLSFLFLIISALWHAVRTKTTAPHFIDAGSSHPWRGGVPPPKFFGKYRSGGGFPPIWGDPPIWGRSPPYGGNPPIWGVPLHMGGLPPYGGLPTQKNGGVPLPHFFGFPQMILGEGDPPPHLTVFVLVGCELPFSGTFCCGNLTFLIFGGPKFQFRGPNSYFWGVPPPHCQKV